MSSIPSGAWARARSSGERMSASAVARSGERKASSLTGGFSGRERGERVWGNREVPSLQQRRGSVGETWFPPRERAGGERRSRASVGGGLRDRLAIHVAGHAVHEPLAALEDEGRRPVTHVVLRGERAGLLVVRHVEGEEAHTGRK